MSRSSRWTRRAGTWCPPGPCLVQERVEQRARLQPTGPVTHHARRLVDHDQPLVLVQDRDVQGLGRVDLADPCLRKRDDYRVALTQ